MSRLESFYTAKISNIMEESGPYGSYWRFNFTNSKGGCIDAESALVFLHKHVLDSELGKFQGLVWAKRPKKVPVVFSRNEVKAIMDNMHGTYFLMAILLYGSGLRTTGGLDKVCYTKTEFVWHVPLGRASHIT